MLRSVILASLCLSLGGCVTNTLATQNQQVALPAAGAGAGAPARPPTVVETPTLRLATARLISMHKTTMAGKTLMLASPQALAADCSPLGEVGAKVLTPPGNGTIRIAHGMAFSDFVPGDPPFLCNTRKTPATLITYRASPGFSGEDTAVVRIVFPDGRAPTIVFHITVL
jgi:hypothetical protein